jgi:hypothetical protein
MIKCLECGKDVNRLQWTHFKFKCSGKIINCNDYLEKYPTAKLVDESIAKKTTLSLENMIKKYGQVEGEKRWNSYREKQALSNQFEYKNKKHGWTKEQFDSYNSSRAITLKKCIERYGEKEGLSKWHSYCDKQAYTNTKEYFVEKYGIELGQKKYIEYNKQKGTSGSAIAVADKLNVTLDEAVEIILSRKSSKENLGSKIEKEFTELLESKIGKLEHTTFNKPFGKWCHDLNSYVIFDIKHQDCVIEFNGDYWHCNPEIYKENKKIIGNAFAKDVWEKDKKKIQTAINHGFRVLVVWENEFRKNKQETIERVIKWMQSGQK